MRQSGKSFITRGIRTNVTLRSALGTRSRTSIYTFRSSRKVNQNSRKHLLERQASRNYISPSINAAVLRNTRCHPNETVGELSTSSVESVENNRIEIGTAIFRSTIVVMTSIGKVN